METIVFDSKADVENEAINVLSNGRLIKINCKM
jgi:hypothetical protein